MLIGSAPPESASPINAKPDGTTRNVVMVPLPGLAAKRNEPSWLRTSDPCYWSGSSIPPDLCRESKPALERQVDFAFLSSRHHPGLRFKCNPTIGLWKRRSRENDALKFDCGGFQHAEICGSIDYAKMLIDSFPTIP
jgi:hypothetical protein